MPVAVKVVRQLNPALQIQLSVDNAETVLNDAGAGLSGFGDLLVAKAVHRQFEGAAFAGREFWH